MTKTEEMLNKIADHIIDTADTDLLTPSYEEMAKVMDVSVETVKSLLREEYALRYCYVTVPGLNPNWYNNYAHDVKIVGAIKKQLMSLPIKQVI
jgi:hypothetical protein